MFFWGALPLTVWQLHRRSCGTPRRRRCYEPVNKRVTVTDDWLTTKCCFFLIAIENLGEALLAVIFKVFWVDVDVVPVDAVRLGELGGVLDELLHLHGRLVFTQVFKGPHWDVRRGDAVWRRRDSQTNHQGLGTKRSKDRGRF